MYLSLYLKAGNLLNVNELIPSPESIFFLEEPEIAELLTRQSSGAIQIGARQLEFEAFRAAAPGNRVEIPPDPLVKRKADPEASELLIGTTCFPGQAEGEAIVVYSPEDDLTVAGKILVASRTDPGWAALFPTCKAVLIEKGSSLSHSVILLRELGIPTLINLAGLTQRIRSGQNLRVDATGGTVEILP